MKKRHMLFHCATVLMPVLALMLGLALLHGCETAGQAGAMFAAAAVASGDLTPEQGEAMAKTSMAMAKAFTKITPEQEHYIGRAIAASIVYRYKPYNNPTANRYINVIGQCMAAASDMPDTFGGYHFLILNSDEINAFAAPGGLIMITRGLLRCCPNEDAVAAVLAHEVGHVQLRHGLKSIKNNRLAFAVRTLAVAGGSMKGAKVAELTRELEGSIGDVFSEMIDKGYSRKSELQADLVAIDILQRVGYEPRALVEMLRQMTQRLQPGGPGFAKTHPAPADRIAALQPQLPPRKPPLNNSKRDKRFKQALKDI